MFNRLYKRLYRVNTPQSVGITNNQLIDTGETSFRYEVHCGQFLPASRYLVEWCIVDILKDLFYIFRVPERAHTFRDRQGATVKYFTPYSTSVRLFLSSCSSFIIYCQSKPMAADMHQRSVLYHSVIVNYWVIDGGSNLSACPSCRSLWLPPFW